MSATAVWGPHAMAWLAAVGVAFRVECAGGMLGGCSNRPLFLLVLSARSTATERNKALNRDIDDERDDTDSTASGAGDDEDATVEALDPESVSNGPAGRPFLWASVRGG